MRVTGYYPGWVQRSVPPAGLPWDAMTHVAHFGRYPLPSGALPVADMQLEAFHAPLVAEAHARSRRALLTVGGGGEFGGQTIGANFAAACATPTSRGALVRSVVALVDQYGYDGADIDWEEGVVAAADRWVQLHADLRAALGPARLLTTCVVSGLVPGRVAALARDTVDAYHVMSYWTDGADQLAHYRAAGIPAAQIMLGAGMSADPDFADRTAAAVAAKVAVARDGGCRGVLFWQVGDLRPTATTDARLQPLREAIMPTGADIPAILRAGGLRVGVVPDFATNGHGQGPLNFGGHLLHHTAGSGLQAVYAWPGRWGDLRPDVPSPRCNLWVPRTTDGGYDVWCVSAGVAYHAGAGSSFALDDILAGRIDSATRDAAVRGLVDDASTPGNSRLLGWEVENLGTSADPYPAGQLDRLAYGIRLINEAAGLTPGHVGHHRQYTRRKIDMSWRGDIWGRIPAAAAPEEDDMSQEQYDALMAQVVASRDEILRQLAANLGAAAVNNPLSWVNAGIAARLGANARRDFGSLLDDEAVQVAATDAAAQKILAAVSQIVTDPGIPNSDPDAVASALRDYLVRETGQPDQPPTPTPPTTLERP